MNVKRRNRIIIGTIAGIVVLSLVLPIRFPYSINTSAKLLPAHVWMLHRLSDGSLTATLTDHFPNSVQSYSAFQIERGDVLHFSINENVTNSGRICQGDTIGKIISNQTELEISRLRGELESAQAMLSVNLSGEKEAILQEARDRLALSSEKSALQQKILERQKELYERNLISNETYEIAAGTARIYELEATMARAQQEALETGAKPEYLAFLRSEIFRIQSLLQILEERKKDYFLCSPIDGKIYQTFSNDTLIVIGDTLWAALIPVPQRSINEIQTGQFFSVKTMIHIDDQTGKILKINPAVQIINGVQYFICTGVLDPISAEVPYNLVVNCSIEGEPKTLIHQLNDFLSSVFM